MVYATITKPRLQASADSEACCENGCQSEELNKAEVLGVFDMAPEDELEGELVFFQHRLLDIKLKRRHFCDGLVCSAVKSLPSQIYFVRSQRWASVCVNKYVAVVREAKKQGKKEQREREAQLVLAAASSSRISMFRKDDLDESSQENPAKASHMLRPVSQSQCMPVPKEMMSREAVPGKESDFLQSDKDNPRSCDVCCHQETILSAILICSICKVSVHLNCYHSKDSIGPWLCEFCEDMTSRCSRPLPVNSWKRLSAECAVCGGTLGAFRKSADGQWIHAFCAEWTLQSTFRKGQIDPIGGLESITMGNDACCVCRLKKGFCLKVEPERLHLLCEQIVRRVKLKRDSLICSHDILASKRDSVAFSILVRSPFFRPDVSSDSATTSLYNSGSETIRKSDDMTVDSSSSVKKPLNLVGSIENDRKTNDGSTTQLVSDRKQSQRIPCAGKKIPNRTSSIFRNLSDDSGNSLIGQILESYQRRSTRNLS